MKPLKKHGLRAASCIFALSHLAAAQSLDAEHAPPARLDSAPLYELPPVLEPAPNGGFTPPDSADQLPPWMAPTRRAAGAIERSTLGTALDLARPGSVNDLLFEPLVDETDGSEIWVRTRNQRTCFGADAVTVYPAFGARALDESPVRFEVIRATSGGSEIAAGAELTPLTSANRSAVTLRRGGFTERWNLSLDAVEQTFEFTALPERGALSVTMRITTDLRAVDSPDELAFVDDELGRVTYGSAIAFDASGKETAVERTYANGLLTLTVPAEFISSAVLPVTIDPPIATYAVTGSFPDDSAPDITFARQPGRYFLVWEEYTSQTNSDCYLTSFSANGLQGPVVAIETGNDFWARPRLAYLPAGNRILIVASSTPDGPGTSPSSIEGRLFDAVNGTASTPIFTISTVGSQKVAPVVGGTNFVGTSNNYFIVAWSRILSSTRHSIEYRIVNWNSVPITDVVTLTSTEGTRSHQPAVSASLGDSALSGDFWTLVWVDDAAITSFLNGP
ncbi:MAG: hypothetical protein AAGG01_10630, partial [Planctomycetota bacterium]